MTNHADNRGVLPGSGEIAKSMNENEEQFNPYEAPTALDGTADESPGIVLKVGASLVSFCVGWMVALAVLIAWDVHLARFLMPYWVGISCAAIFGSVTTVLWYGLLIRTVLGKRNNDARENDE